MLYKEVEASEKNLNILIQLSKKWEEENNCYGYVANTKDDLTGKKIFFAYDDEEVIGYLFGQFFVAENIHSIIPDNEKCFEVEEIYVSSNCRSKGIGKALFDFVEDSIKDKAKYILLSTSSKNRKAIFHFYIDELNMSFWSAKLFKKLS